MPTWVSCISEEVSPSCATQQVALGLLFKVEVRCHWYFTLVKEGQSVFGPGTPC